MSFLSPSLLAIPVLSKHCSWFSSCHPTNICFVSRSVSHPSMCACCWMQKTKNDHRQWRNYYCRESSLQNSARGGRNNLKSDYSCLLVCDIHSFFLHLSYNQILLIDAVRQFFENWLFAVPRVRTKAPYVSYWDTIHQAQKVNDNVPYYHQNQY